MAGELEGIEWEEFRRIEWNGERPGDVERVRYALGAPTAGFAATELMNEIDSINIVLLLNNDCYVFLIENQTSKEEKPIIMKSQL